MYNIVWLSKSAVNSNIKKHLETCLCFIFGYFSVSIFYSKLNYDLFIADIETDRKSYDAWRRYTIKVREMD